MSSKQNLTLSSTLLVCLALTMTACGSQTADGGGANSTVSTGTLMSLERQGTAPTGVVVVYEDGSWILTSHDACSEAEGKLSEADMTPLRQYIADPALKMLATTCSDHAFILRGTNLVPMGCWDGTQSAAAPMTTGALAKFFDARVAQLPSSTPKESCPEQGPPSISDEVKLSGAAGAPPARK